MRDLSVLENLKEQKIWFCWKLENKKNSSKPTKVPYSAITGLRTGTDEKFRKTWTDFATACSVQKKGYSGVGFKIPENMAFLDIDHVNADNPVVKSVDAKLGTYAETSQSGNGVHFYFYSNYSGPPLALLQNNL